VLLTNWRVYREPLARYYGNEAGYGRRQVVGCSAERDAGPGTGSVGHGAAIRDEAIGRPCLVERRRDSRRDIIGEKSRVTAAAQQAEERGDVRVQHE